MTEYAKIHVIPRAGLYLCSRASAPDEKPCDEAFLVTFTRARHHIGAKEGWAVEIDDIMAFVDKYGDCVVSRDDNGFCAIHIYDGYIE